MTGKQKLWVISELFPPEETSTGYIMGLIANALISKYNVSVICGPEIYDSKKKAVYDSSVTIDSSIKLYRVAGVVENKKSKISRIKKFLLMSYRIYRVAKKNVKKGDKVLMVSNPFPLIVLMAFLKRHREFTLNILVHDVFPEGLYTEMSLPPFVYKILGEIFNKSYATADLLISLGRDMSEILIRKTKKYDHQPNICIIENWGDTEAIKPLDTLISERIKIQYAGNIGRAQGVGDFVEILNNAGNPDVMFNIWGTGSEEEEIKSRVSELGLSEQVVFNGPYFRFNQINVLNDSDLSLVTLVKGMYGLGVPSKTYNILAAGKPILYIGEKNTEIWCTIEENNIGYCFEPDDADALLRFVRGIKKEDLVLFKAMGLKARTLAEKNYSICVILNKFIRIM